MSYNYYFVNFLPIVLQHTYSLLIFALSCNIPETCSVTVISKSLDTFSPIEISIGQHKDSVWSRLIYFLESGDESNLPYITSLSSYVLQDDILYKGTTLTGIHEPTRLVHQLVISDSLVIHLLKLIYDSSHAGHLGKEKCLAQARMKYLWRTDINHIMDLYHTCTSCLGNNVHSPVFIHNYPFPSQPWILGAIDLLKLPLVQYGNQCVCCH